MQFEMSAGYELSPQQRQIFAQKQENTTAGIALLLEGELQSSSLRNALAALIERHEILRSSFPRRPGMKFPFQVVRDRAEASWNEIDLSMMSEAQQRSEIEEILRSSQGINIEDGTLVHATLVKLGTARYALTLTFSILAVDQNSLNTIRSDFSLHYSGAPVAGDVLQYADYSEWQNGCLRTDDEEARRAAQFWNKVRSEGLPALSLPFEHKRARAGGRSTAVVLSLDSSLVQRTRAEADRFLLACWQVFLWRMTGQQEFAIGYQSDGRNHDEFQGGFGPFAKTLPLSLNFESKPSFAEFVSQSEKTRALASEWQDYFPGELASMGPTVGFASYSVVDHPIPELMRYLPAHDVRLQLRLRHTGEAFECALVYDSAWFDHQTVAHFVEAFSLLCRTAQQDPSLEIDRLPITTDSERDRVTIKFNQTTIEYPRDKCIHQLFEQCARTYPERPALRFEDQEFNYSDLDREANRVAHVLLQNGVSTGVPVALAMERSGDMIIALLGILKAGGCYVPLVPDNPKSRLAHQLEETGSPVVLTQEAHLDRLPQFKGKIISLDRDRAQLASAPDTSPGVNVSPQDVVYVIYTSGSTGTPKGVAIRHFSLVNYSRFICQRLSVDKHSRGLHFATVSTIAADLGNTCIFPSLISGGCLHVISFERAMSPALFADYARQHPIDVLKITPSHLASLLDSDEAASVLPQTNLVLGGEATRWDLIDRIRKLGRCSIFNHYGPTEATVGCCTFSVDNTDVSAWEPATVPIGQPIANDTVYIVDHRMQPVPVGVVGELAIGGTGIAQGYFNQPQQTAERFVRDSFSHDAGARLYRTGDLARFLPDGNIEFLGRIDQQVKIRGFRVEPAEIEAVLKLHPSVKQAAVVPFEDKTGEKRLAAYVMGRFRAEELRTHLTQYLPEYMVPQAFVAVEVLPLTPNGKLDLRALPSPEIESPVRERVAPRTADEEKLAEIWKEVLKLETVSVNDDFFELGGHSLLATQIISRIRNRFRVQMPLQVFLENPNIAQLAGQISKYPAIETEQEEMARLLQELEGISEEDAERLLAAKVEQDDTGHGL